MSSAVLPQPVFPSRNVRRITVEEYHRMIDAAVLRSGEPVELLRGWLVEKMGKNPPHSSACEMLREQLTNLLPPGTSLRCQNPVTLPPDSEPEPDLAVVRGSSGDYRKRHPGPADVLLVVEVSDSTLAEDRTVMGALYASAGIPVYWIVNLVADEVEVYTDPAGTGDAARYQQNRHFFISDEVPLVLGGAEVGRIPVRDLIP